MVDAYHRYLIRCVKKFGLYAKSNGKSFKDFKKEAGVISEFHLKGNVAALLGEGFDR